MDGCGINKGLEARKLNLVQAHEISNFTLQASGANVAQISGVV